MAIEADGIRRRTERLKGLAGKMEEEWARVSRDGGPLTWSEQQYVKGIREAADALERTHQVLSDARGGSAGRRCDLNRFGTGRAAGPDPPTDRPVRIFQRPGRG